MLSGGAMLRSSASFILLGSLLAAPLAACSGSVADTDSPAVGGKADEVEPLALTVQQVVVGELDPLVLGDACLVFAEFEDGLGMALLRKEEQCSIELAAGDVVVIDEDELADLTADEETAIQDLAASFSVPLDLISFREWRVTPAEDRPLRVTCFLNRREGVDGKEKRVQSTVKVEDEAFSNSNGLEVFAANYSFDLNIFETDLEVFFFENFHVQDEIGGLSCGDVSKLPRPTTFCREPIFVDKNLGTDKEDEENVHAFNFWCRLH